MSALVETSLEQSKKQKANAKLLVAIRFHVKEKFHEALTEGADIDNTELSTPLATAIRHSNRWAFNELLKMGANAKLIGDNKISPWISAACTGDEEMAKTLLSKGVNPNDYCSNNALGYAIGCLSSYSLVEFGKWHKENPAIHGNDKPLQAQLKDWFYQRGETFTSSDKRIVIPFPTTDQPLRVLFDGKCDYIGFLLSDAGVLTSTPNRAGHSPTMVVQEPGKYPKYFLNSQNNLEYQSTEGNIVTFKMQLQTYNEKGTIDIIIDYDFTKIQAMFAEHHKHRPSMAHHTDAEWKAFGEAVQIKITDDVSERIDHVHTQLTAVRQQVKVVDSKIDAEHKQVAELAHQMDPLLVEKAHQTALAARQQIVEKNPVTNSFNVALNAKLRAKISGAVTLHGGDTERAKNTNLDLASTAVDFVVSHIPVFGPLAGGLLSMGISAYADMKEDEKHKRIARLFGSTAEADAFAQEVALELTEHCNVYLTCQEVIKNEKEAEKLGEKLAAASYLILLMADPKDKAKLKEKVFDEVVKSKVLDKQFSAYRQSAAYLQSDIDSASAQSRSRSPVAFSNTAIAVSHTSNAHKKSTGDVKKRGSDEKKSKWNFFHGKTTVQTSS